MKLKQITLTAALVLAGLSFQAQADCAFPKAPASIPDGSTATEPEMIAAMNAFKAYDAEVKAFGACLDQEAKSASSMQAKAMQAKKMAAANDELQSKAKAFNEQVRVFKARG